MFVFVLGHERRRKSTGRGLARPRIAASADPGAVCTVTRPGRQLSAILKLASDSLRPEDSNARSHGGTLRPDYLISYFEARPRRLMRLLHCLKLDPLVLESESYLASLGRPVEIRLSIIQEGDPGPGRNMCWELNS